MCSTYDNITCVNKNIILSQLKDMQIKQMKKSKKLQYNDLRRIVKYIENPIFGDECCIWKGYITNSKPDKNYKGAYVNFYFKNKKVALHRLLYLNFKGSIDENEYLKYTCDNKGKCCNVNHMVKFPYSTKKKFVNKKELSDKSTEIKKIKKTQDVKELNDDFFILKFT